MAQDLRTNSFFSAILFGIFLIVIINIFFYINSRDRAYLYYILYHSFVLILIFNMSGLLNHYPSMSWIANNYATAIMPFILSSFFFACFVRSFLNTPELTPKLDKAISIYLIAYPLALLLVLVLFKDAIKYYGIINLIGLSSVPLYLLVMAVHIKLKNRPAIFFTLSFSILLTLTVVRFLYIWDLLPQTFITQFGVIIGVFLETLIFSVGLADRMVQLQRQKDLAEIAKAKTDFAYSLEKDFNKLLSNINSHIHQSEEVDHQQYIVDKFFSEFKDTLGVNSNAVIYSNNDGIKTIYDSRHQNGKHFDIVEANIKQIAFIAKSGQAKKIHGKNGQFMVVPAQVRDYEWSACLIELGTEFNDRKAIRKFMYSYAHELIHCLLNAESLRKIKTKAEIDKLTGLYNRGAIEALIEHTLSMPFEQNKPLSIAFIDFDDFKLINDQFGHKAGDQCLALLATTFKENLPPGAQMGRYGGDEFLVVLPHCNQPMALQIINRIKNKISVLEHEQNIINFSISVGIATQNSATDTMSTLFDAADKALYDSKHSGKNAINVA
ncbi:MAG: diguanylate cyclase [Gammaproteobacteria bacterium]|nr:diguanylate cyclase [Gammaproteobacteria bacterium]